MKYFPLSFLILLFSHFAFTQPFTDPSTYNNFIVNAQERILNLNINYVMESVHNDNYQAVENQRLKLIQELEKTIEQIRAMPAYDGKTKLRDEAVAVFSLYLDAFKMEFKEANMLKAQRAESYQAMEDYYKAQEKAEKKLEVASEKLLKAQEQFAREHDMIIQGEETSPEESTIKVINRVNSYARAVFLAYFKVSKDDAAILDAMSAEDPKRMETHRKKLLVSIAESTKKLQELGPYGTYDEFRQSALDLIDFHRHMAEKGYVDIIAFLKKKRKNEYELTQKDADMYNAVIEVLNTQPPLLHTRFNEMNSAFLKKFIPGGGTRT